MTPHVTFTVWSDFLCPWCYVAATRIHEVQREVGDVLRVEWRSFLLRPEPKARTLEQFRHYTQSWHRPAEAEPAAEFAYWEGDAVPPSHSMPALVAGKVAATFGSDAFDRFHFALMRAYFAQNRTISAREVQLDVAREVALDATEFAARLDTSGSALEADVVADHKAALALGFAAVPTIVIDDEDVVTGALPVASYSKIVARRAS